MFVWPCAPASSRGKKKTASWLHCFPASTILRPQTAEAAEFWWLCFWGQQTVWLDPSNFYLLLDTRAGQGVMDKDGGFLAETLEGCEAYSIFTLAFSYLFLFLIFEAVCAAEASCKPRVTHAAFRQKKKSDMDTGGSLHVRRLLKWNERIKMATRAAVRLTVALTVIDKVVQQEEKWNTTGAARDLSDGILKILNLSCSLQAAQLVTWEPAPWIDFSCFIVDVAALVWSYLS